MGTDLALGVSTPATLALSHAAPATATSVATVTSTQLSWTLSISDNNTGVNAGHMVKTAGTGAAATGAPLAGALEWSPDAATFSPLSGAPATVGTGTLVGTKTVTLRQALDASEDVTSDDVYSLTAKYTVN